MTNDSTVDRQSNRRIVKHSASISLHITCSLLMICFAEKRTTLLDRNILRKAEVLYKKECLETKDLPLKYFETLHVRWKLIACRWP